MRRMVCQHGACPQRRSTGGLASSLVLVVTLSVAQRADAGELPPIVFALEDLSSVREDSRGPSPRPGAGGKLMLRAADGTVRELVANHTNPATRPIAYADPDVSYDGRRIVFSGYSVAERSGVYYDPRYANHIYVGLENKVYKSTDGGLSFEVIHTFPGTNGRIYEMEISRSNPDVIYGVYNQSGGYWDPCKIWKSEDGGTTWNPTATDPTGNNRRFRISVHPEDENTVWICTPRGDNGHKVFNTTDGGDTWINKTTSNLDGEDVTDILYQGGTNDLVYVTSQYGVLYWDSAQNNWIDYSTDLPLVAKAFQINPFYRDSELRLASNGRGVWGREMLETEFIPIAQPIT